VHVHGHWLLELFWLGLLRALILEVIFLGQAIRVGRAEYLRNGTQAQCTALVIAGAVAFVVVWEYMKVVWDDPLYQAVPAITLFLIPLATATLLLRRQSAVAQSPVSYGCFAAMVVLWWAVTAGYYGEGFASWQYLVTGVVAFVMLVGVTVAVARMRMNAEGRVPATVEGVTHSSASRTR
jgi:hypothetical protein